MLIAHTPNPPRIVVGRIFVSYPDAPDKWHRFARCPVAELASRLDLLRATATGGETYKGVEC
jgi:hypothetical protein